VPYSARPFSFSGLAFADDRAELRSGFKQLGGFVADDLQITLFIDIGVVAVHQLHDFAFGDDVGGVGKNAHDVHVAYIDHHLERTRIERVPDQDAGRVAEQDVGCFSVAPQVGLIDDVIVQQGCRVDEFDDRGKLMVTRPAITQRAGAEEHQDRAQTLASGIDDVFGDLFDEQRVGMQFPANQRIDGLHVRFDQRVELFEFQRDQPGGKRPFMERGSVLLLGRPAGVKSALTRYFAAQRHA